MLRNRAAFANKALAFCKDQNYHSAVNPKHDGRYAVLAVQANHSLVMLRSNDKKGSSGKSWNSSYFSVTEH